MAGLQVDNAVNYANQVMNIVQQLRNLRAACVEIVTINGTTPLGNLWTVLKTAALNTDGTLGTADGSVTSTNPIDTRVYTAMSRAVKSGDLTNALQCIVDFDSFMAGSSLSANGARPANINAVSI